MSVIAFGYPSTLMLISNVALTENELQSEHLGRAKQRVSEGDLLARTVVCILLLMRNFNQLKGA